MAGGPQTVKNDRLPVLLSSSQSSHDLLISRAQQWSGVGAGSPLNFTFPYPTPSGAVLHLIFLRLTSRTLLCRT